MIDDQSEPGSWQRELDALPKTTGELRLELADLRNQANQLARHNEQLQVELTNLKFRGLELRRALAACGIDVETILKLHAVIHGVKPEEQR